MREEEIDGKKIVLDRVKIYNKLVHLLTAGQFKWIGMALNKIFNPS